MTSRLNNFLRELRRRRVFHMTAVYVIAAWVLLQVAALAFPALEIRETALRYVWLAVLLGFPLAVVFSWRYDITADGIRRTPPHAGAAAEKLALRKTDYLLLKAE